MFRKVREYGKAYGQAWKTAYDPERRSADRERYASSAYSMPKSGPESEPHHTGLVPEEPVPSAQALARRQDAIRPLRSEHARPATLDLLYTRSPYPSELIAALRPYDIDAATVFGIYPSSQLLQPSALRTGGAWWEWCVLHAGGPALSQQLAQANEASMAGRLETPQFDKVAVVQMSRVNRWLDRSKEAPALFDEEAAVALLLAAEVDPAWSFGLARVLSWEPSGDPDMQPSPSWMGGPGSTHGVTVEPIGAQVLLHAGTRATARFPQLAPVPFPGEIDLQRDRGVTVELLWWDPICRASQLIWTRPPADPTPFPRLPTTPEELLMTYLQIVGVSPADCYGVSSTAMLQQHAFIHPDDEDAERGQAASAITIAYRERPAYADGRQRFEQYRADQIRTSLTVPRPEVSKIEKVGTSGMKVYLKHQLGDETYSEVGGDELYDADMYPYLFGPLPGR